MDASFDYVRRIVPATETMIFVPGQWWLAGAAIDLYFSQSLYYDSSAGGAGQAVTSYLSCVRASAGYARTVAGVLTSFAVNTLRITNSGLLVEDARTNIQVSSQDLSDTGQWNRVNIVSLTADATAAPDGTITADLVVPNTTNSGSHYVGASGGGLSNGQVTASCYLKAAGYNYAGVGISYGGGAAQWIALVNLTNGTIEATSNRGTSPTNTNQVVETLANGWYRLSVTMDTTIASASGSCEVFSTNSFSSYAGDGTSGIYAWGFQIENGSFSSSYIPTTTGSVTRAADAVTVIGNLNTLLSTLPHSDVVDVTMSAVPASWYIVSDSGTTASESLSSFDNLVSSAGSINALFGSGLFTTGAKVGFGIATGARSIVGNAGSVATSATAVAMTSTDIGLGSRNGASPIYGYIRRFTAWNSKLADATLQGFTV